MNKKIGIDIGHCDTAASYPQMRLGMQGFEVRRLYVQDRDYVILTQIVLTYPQMQMLKGNTRPDYDLLKQLGTITFGNRVTKTVQDGEKFSFFKDKPENFDMLYGCSEAAKEAGITHGMLMSCYAFALVNSILSHNPDVFSESERVNIDLLIGCPTTPAWTSPAAREEYASLIKNATGVHDVQIVPESRAAMFHSIENGKNKISASKGAIVFDFGSSTADCTYMLLGKKRIEFSWELGASKIEQQMSVIAMRDAQEKARKEEKEKINPRKVLLDYPNEASRVEMVDDMRGAKELYYNNIYGEKGHLMSFRCVNSLSAEEDKFLNPVINIDSGFMREVTAVSDISATHDIDGDGSRAVSKGTWQSLCKDFFTEARRRTVDEDIPIDTIVLTGGASKMGFIKELCQEVFYMVPSENIHLEDNPSHTVAGGLGWVAVSDDRLKDCKEKAKREIESNCGIKELRKSVSKRVYKKIRKICKNIVQDWADQPDDQLTLEDLQEAISDYMKENKKEIRDDLSRICEKEIASWEEELPGKMVNAVNAQVASLYSENLAKECVVPDDIFDNLPMIRIHIKALIKPVLDAVDDITFSAGLLDRFMKAFAENLGIKRRGAISQKKRQDAVDDIMEEIESRKGDITKGVKKQFVDMKEQFSETLDNALQTAFEIATLMRFDA